MHFSASCPWLSSPRPVQAIFFAALPLAPQQVYILYIYIVYTLLPAAHVTKCLYTDSRSIGSEEPCQHVCSQNNILLNPDDAATVWSQALLVECKDTVRGLREHHAQMWLNAPCLLPLH